MKIGIFVYDNAEVLDFAGPFEVFSTAKRLAGNDWEVLLIAEQQTLVRARGGFDVQPHFSFDSTPNIDVLIIVGGVHNEEVKKSKVIDWIKNLVPNTNMVASVCTGAFLLAKAGVITDHCVTTHWEDIADLRAEFPLLEVKENVRWVKQGNIVTSAGISAGIDMSLFLVSEIASMDLALKTAKQMDYDWQKNS
ncbi:DJ-1/PfpI family protein [Vibrio ziniensis]|uniref:DJ-1/PfpI family protein n=1 Tax=Vibrio ziniensis TaxID=2711221 RepID=A0A6G7CQ66_9VIBR|nr:DJ-1/PfpI family protein [Vibrio ziniensis]QIH44186.1 DJ-1/PfpI family protein [Vibrio ziniensis]